MRKTFQRVSSTSETHCPHIHSRCDFKSFAVRGTLTCQYLAMQVDGASGRALLPEREVGLDPEDFDSPCQSDLPLRFAVVFYSFIPQLAASSPWLLGPMDMVSKRFLGMGLGVCLRFCTCSRFCKLHKTIASTRAGWNVSYDLVRHDFSGNRSLRIRFLIDELLLQA